MIVNALLHMPGMSTIFTLMKVGPTIIIFIIYIINYIFTIIVRPTLIGLKYGNISYRSMAFGGSNFTPSTQEEACVRNTQDPDSNVSNG